MGTLILGCVFLAALVSIVIPWIGVIDGYLCILLGPQVLWWWAFEGKRHFLIIAGGTMVGMLFSYFKGELNFSFLKSKQNFLLFIWFASTVLSYFFGPYIHGGPGPRYFDSAYLFEIFVKSFLFYLVAVVIITDKRKFRFFGMIIVVVSIYYIYWINSLYLSGYVGRFGRIGGPIGLTSDQYGDENFFALFFVISLPFIYYYGYMFSNLFIRYGLWLIIPFGWHAVFLTGSRGGLLGLGVTILPLVLKSPKKIYGLFLVPALAIAFFWQGGPVMLERVSTIGLEEVDDSGNIEASAQGRIDAWGAAINMMIRHPIVGVGVGSFTTAYPDFSVTKPREAHNTFFQIGAESGVLAMAAYILYLLITIRKLWQFSPPYLPLQDKDENFFNLIHNAVLCAYCGLAVCACFLSLQLFEQFFYLAVMSNFLIKQNQFKKNGNI